MHTLSTALSQWSALTAFNLTDNYAENSGAIHASESKVYVRGETTIAYNAACKWHWRCSVYLDMSELHCQGNISVKVLGNGVHVISSSINVEGNITNNSIADENMYSCSFWIWEGWSTLSGNANYSNPGQAVSHSLWSTLLPIQQTMAELYVHQMILT